MNIITYQTLQVYSVLSEAKGEPTNNNMLVYISRKGYLVNEIF